MVSIWLNSHVEVVDIAWSGVYSLILAHLWSLLVWLDLPKFKLFLHLILLMHRYHLSKLCLRVLHLSLEVVQIWVHLIFTSQLVNQKLISGCSLSIFILNHLNISKLCLNLLLLCLNFWNHILKLLSSLIETYILRFVSLNLTFRCAGYLIIIFILRTFSPRHWSSPRTHGHLWLILLLFFIFWLCVYLLVLRVLS